MRLASTARRRKVFVEYEFHLLQSGSSLLLLHWHVIDIYRTWYHFMENLASLLQVTIMSFPKRINYPLEAR
jgi:hypothetical protein